MSVLPISVPTKRLAAPITSSALSFTVSNIKGWDGNNLTSGQFGTLHYVAFRNSTNTAMEIVEIDPSTIASASITITKRGLDFVGGTTSVAANQLAWPANDTLVDFGTDPAQLLTQGFMDLWTNQTAAGIKTFSVPPVSATNPTGSTQIANKAYVDLVAGGSASYDQNIIGGTAGETLSAGKIVYFKSSDSRWWLATQATASTCVGVQLGIAQGSSTAGNAINVLIGGVDKNQSGLTSGSDYYLGASGAISTSAGATSEVFIGRATSTTTIAFAPWFSKAFLGNDTGIKLGTGNKLITQTGLQNQAETYASSGGSANAYTLTLSPVPIAYAAGQGFRFKANFTNTGSATLNVNSLGAITIKKTDGATNLAANDIISGQVVTVIYDGTNFQMASPIGQALLYKSVTATKNTADASTTQTIAHGLGIIPKYVRITAIAPSSTAAFIFKQSLTVYNGTTQNSLSAYGPSNAAPTVDTTFTISDTGNTTSASQAGVVTCDATNVSIVWTKTGSPTGIYTLLVEAFA